jgi:hypothetical protein
VPLGPYVDKALAVERQCQCAAQIGIVEGRGVAVDRQVGLALEGTSSQTACGD